MAKQAQRFERILIANRGEIAIRVARAAAELGIETVAVYSADDEGSLHINQCHRALRLQGSGPKAYLDIDRVIAAAREADCDAVHPGYGFLSESSAFARRCAEEGIAFIGPDPAALELFGDKVQARSFAMSHSVPVPGGTLGSTTLEEAQNFFKSLPAGRGVMIKALAGGGGRGMRVVERAEDIEASFSACAVEALASFGNGDLYVEELLRNCRHIEVQIVGDGSSKPVALGERECSLQRRNQKVIEVAPCLHLPQDRRDAMTEAAIRMAGAIGYRGLGTFEFLVPKVRSGNDGKGACFYFIEANPRVQVEHTVTDQVFGVDLVKSQIEIAQGRSLESLGLRMRAMSGPKGMAIQCRVNLESIDTSGSILPSAGTIDAYEPPSGLGIRVDGFGYAGYTNSPRFDSLLAKLIVFTVSDEDFDTLLARARWAVGSFLVGGVSTNLDFLANLLDRQELRSGDIDTRFIDGHIVDLARPRLPKAGFSRTKSKVSNDTEARSPGINLREGEIPVFPPMSGMIGTILVSAGDRVVQNQPVATVEAMKMEFTVKSPVSGTIVDVFATSGQLSSASIAICAIAPSQDGEHEGHLVSELDLEVIRPDLAELFERKSYLEDAARPAVADKRHRLGRRTARENLADLCDPDTFLEYGGLAVAAQRSRFPVDHLIRNTPTDGIITGVGQVNGELFGPDESSCVLALYDYTVLAGTQGHFNHKKQDRIFHLASQLKRPLILYAEGGGGRPGDTDKDLLVGGWVGSPTFAAFGRLSGLIPIVGVVSGRCFAGNAALLGCCDVIIATRNTNIGMGGPAMIEGGGLGVFKPEEVGPSDLQERNGVIDVLTENDLEATAIAKKYVAYFQGDLPHWTCADQRALRFAVPQQRKHAFDIRELITTLCDEDSVLELRPRFGRALVTALVRIEGRAFGLVANDPTVLGGALDADASIKGTRFTQLCDAFDIPLVALLDTPGFMVGPEAEAEALVRKACGLFVAGASLDIPVFTVIVRRSYGLGAQATAAGHLTGSTFCVAWPTGELGAMGFEGAVHLGYRKELAAIADPAERDREFQRLVSEMYMRGRGLNAATVLEVDDVIDPADTRRWIMGLHRAIGRQPSRGRRKRPSVPTW